VLCHQLHGYHVSEDTTSNVSVASSSISKKKMDVRVSSEMLVTIYMTSQLQTHTDHNFDICNYENLKSKVN